MRFGIAAAKARVRPGLNQVCDLDGVSLRGVGTLPRVPTVHLGSAAGSTPFLQQKIYTGPVGPPCATTIFNGGGEEPRRTPPSRSSARRGHTPPPARRQRRAGRGCRPRWAQGAGSGGPGHARKSVQPPRVSGGHRSYFFVSDKETPLLVEVARARGSHHFRARAASTKSGVSLPETKL